jgi:hypothetical protein
MSPRRSVSGRPSNLRRSAFLAVRRMRSGISADQQWLGSELRGGGGATGGGCGWGKCEEGRREARVGMGVAAVVVGCRFWRGEGWEGTWSEF